MCIKRVLVYFCSVANFALIKRYNLTFNGRLFGYFLLLLFTYLIVFKEKENTSLQAAVSQFENKVGLLFF